VRPFEASRVLGVLLVAAAVGCGGGGGSDLAGSSGSSSSQTFSTEQKSGIATYYDADGSGNCSFDRSPSDLDVVALNMPEYAKSALCGACMRVSGPKGEVTVRVVDSCPPCEKNHLDLSEQAFAKIADLAHGRIAVNYQLVSCDVRGNVAYRFKEGSSKWWTAIQVRNHRLPVARMEYRKGDTYVAMKRESYNYFVEVDGVGDQPNGLALRLTAADGQVLEDTLEGVKDSETLTGSAQFR
jgi:expansin